jgi:uncharacterized protein YcfJ
MTMKNILPGLAIVSILAVSCSNNNTEKELAVLQAKQATIDSMNTVASLKEEATKKTYVVAKKSTPKRSTVRYSSYSDNAALPTATPAPAEQKKGWSNKAKGAVIGGVIGAGAGAVISKEKKVQGAIIGGVLGAGAGYGVGAILDKKKANQYTY